MTRTQAREQAFLVIFQSTFFKNITQMQLLEKSIADEQIVNNEFTEELCCAVFENLREIDELIARHSSKWEVKRISRVAISVLRLAIAELMFMVDIPHRVAINEAIELTKKFTDKEEALFVNGVLGGVAALPAG